MQRHLAAGLLVLSCLARHGVAQDQSVPFSAHWTLVPGSTTAFALWNDGRQDFYALSLDGGMTVATVRPAAHAIMLAGDAFDPLARVPAVAAAVSAHVDSRLFIVQFHTQGCEAYDRALAVLGVEKLCFLAQQAQVVRMSATTAAEVRALPFVRYAGPCHPAWRVEPSVRAELEAGTAPRRWYSIQVARPGAAEKEAVREAALRAGGAVDATIAPAGYLLRAELDAPQLRMILRRDDVLYVDRWMAPEPDMNIVRTLTGATYVSALTGFEGAGIRGEVLDVGCDLGHGDFQARPPLAHGGQSGSSLSHGTATYGQIFGDGTGNPLARGILSSGQGIFADYDVLGDRYAHTAALLQPPFEACFQSNSWGSGLVTAYTTTSADMDNITFDNDILIVQSQSNNGNQFSRPQAWAKNVLSVGGVRHFDTLVTSDDCWGCSGSAASIGPAADGRVKPDICSIYDAILTTTSGGPATYTSSFGGTSGATPTVAACAGILFQMWNEGIFGNGLRRPGGDAFENRPHATTAKALLLNTTTQYPFSGPSVDLARAHQGWGRPDLGRLYDQRAKLFIIDETQTLTPLQARSYTVTVAAAEPELRATLVFADPPGNPMSSIARVNDLDLRVTDPNGVVYFGNSGLQAGTASTPGGVASSVDTVEQVIVPNPPLGVWTVEVTAQQINQDGHVETPAIDADFALVVSGAQPPVDVGQANHALATLSIPQGVGAHGRTAGIGVPGPFTTTLRAGDAFALNVQSAPQRAFLLLMGPLNANNMAFAGVGSLDLGLLGAVPSFSDVSVLLNGLSPASFLDGLATVGSSGIAGLSFTLPSSIPPGILGAFQLLVIDPTATATDARFTAAFQVIVI
jgi:serine protease AprX